MKWVFFQLWRKERWKLDTLRMLSMWLMLDGMVPQGMDPVGYGVYIDWFITLSILSLFCFLCCVHVWIHGEFGRTTVSSWFCWTSNDSRHFVYHFVNSFLPFCLSRWMILKKFLNFRHQLVTWMKLGTLILWLSLRYGPP